MIKSYPKPLVFCDVETTGHSAKFGKITEIACIRYENGKEVDRLVTLLDPQVDIPYSIEMITGISNDLVRGSPYFHEIAEKVDEIFEGATLVAHNARFDFGFIQSEMERCGLTFNPEYICTARLSRNLFKQYRSHNLSVIIDRFNFKCEARHRALGDTLVLVQFAKYLDKEVEKEKLLKALGQKGLMYLPPNIDEKMLKDIPSSPGVYSFYGKNGELLYVGKSVNLKSRIVSHFSSSLNDPKEKKMWEELHDISYIETASDLGASLLELYLIKKESPIFNRLSRKIKSLWYLKKYINEKGYISFKLDKTENLNDIDMKDIYGVYRTKRQAIEAMEKLVKSHKFCPRLLGIEKGNGLCFSAQLGLCSGACGGKIDNEIYNLKVEIAFKEKLLKAWPYKDKKVIFQKNEKIKKMEKFVVNNWILESAEIYTEEGEGEKLFPVKEELFDYDMYKVLYKYII